MKKLLKFSSILFLLLLALAVNSNTVKGSTNNSAYTGWLSYDFTGSPYIESGPISFKYPADWKLNPEYYTTPGGSKDIISISITSPSGIEQIVFSNGGRQANLDCDILKKMNTSEPKGRLVCKMINGTPFYLTYTTNVNAEGIYNQIVDSITVKAADVMCPAGYTCVLTQPTQTPPPIVDTSVSSCIKLYVNLSVGSTNSSDIKKLQNFLISNKYLSGIASGVFDQDTKSAVIKYQEKVGVPTTGFVGPITRKEINESCTKVGDNPYISIFYPNGTENYKFGKDYLVTWYSSFESKNIKVYLDYYGNANSPVNKFVSPTISSKVGLNSYTIPANATDVSGQYKVRVCSEGSAVLAPCDVSNSTFTIEPFNSTEVAGDIQLKVNTLGFAKNSESYQINLSFTGSSANKQVKKWKINLPCKSDKLTIMSIPGNSCGITEMSNNSGYGNVENKEYYFINKSGINQTVEATLIAYDSNNVLLGKSIIPLVIPPTNVSPVPTQSPSPVPTIVRLGANNALPGERVALYISNFPKNSSYKYYVSFNNESTDSSVDATLSSDGTYLSFAVPNFNPGAYTISAGAYSAFSSENHLPFTIGAPSLNSTESKKPVISSVKSLAGEEMVVYAGERFSIQGKNLLTYASGNTNIYLGGQKVYASQISNDLAWVVAPNLSAGAYYLYVSNENGSSDYVKVNVRSSVSVTGQVVTTGSSVVSKIVKNVKITNKTTGKAMVAGDSLLKNQTYTVSWDAENLNMDSKFSLVLQSVNGSSVYGIIKTGVLDYSTRSYSWTIDSTVPELTELYVSVQLNTGEKANSSVFKVSSSAVVSEGFKNVYPITGYPGTKVTLQLNNPKGLSLRQDDFAFGQYGFVNFTNSNNEVVTFTVPWDALVGPYDIVWFGNETHTIKFNVMSPANTSAAIDWYYQISR
jgi:peptidoglycan hydrolase-like protein with peptidoglycan-binding domain